MRTSFLWLIPSVLIMSCADDPADPSPLSSPELNQAGGEGTGALYIMSNATSGNAVLVFPRAADGSLASPQSFPTEGLGSGGGLGNQGAVRLVQNGRFLYLVNPGSDEITGFRVKGLSLERIGTWPSGGDLPISLTIRQNLLYVLHDGANPGVTGFVISSQGQVTPIANSTRPLSGSPVPDAAQVNFSPDGRRLLVTEKATNLLVTYRVMPGGLLSAPVGTPSAAATPFGFAFSRRGLLLVSEAAGGAPGASSLTSYRRAEGFLTWTAVSPAVGTTETAACWVGLTVNGRFAFVTNTGSGTISGYRVGPDGSLTLLDPDGVTGTTGAAPIDLDLIGNRFLYTLNGGGNSISAFHISPDGELSPLGTTPGIPAGANGLQAR